VSFGIIFECILRIICSIDMKIFFECGVQNSGKTTRINMLLERLLRESSISCRKGRGPGPVFKLIGDRRSDVRQDYLIRVGSKSIRIRFRSSGDSETTVNKNVTEARNADVDILIIATHNVNWITLNEEDSICAFQYKVDSDDDISKSEDMFGQLMVELTGRGSKERCNNVGSMKHAADGCAESGCSRKMSKDVVEPMHSQAALGRGINGLIEASHDGFNLLGV